MIVTRAELHIHTKSSDDLSVIGVKEILEQAKTLGLQTIAFTNLNNVRDWPQIQHRLTWGFAAPKVIYGGEVFYERPDGKGYARMTVLIRNQAGVKDFYKIISSMHRCQDGKKAIDFSVFTAHRENLLVGSCGYDGELYAAIAQNAADETIERIAALYDYFEIYPGKDEQEQIINQKIVALGARLGIPVIAASNAHYITPEDAICHEILYVEEFVANRDSGNRYIYSTEEMLRAFSYLGENTAEDLVINHPLRLAASIEEVLPMKQGFFMIEFPNALETISMLCMDKAHEIYGDPLPEVVASRLQTELNLVRYEDFASQYLLAHKMAKHITENGHYVATRHTAGATLMAFLLGISQINPLSPHYYCPKCHHFEESDLAKDGFDLPVQKCPKCHAPLRADGHNIPHESFMDCNGDKVPDFDLVLSQEIWQSEFAFLQQMFGESNVARAGYFTPFSEKISDAYVDAYEQKTLHFFEPEEQVEIVQKLTGVARSEGTWPGGIMLVPAGMDFEDFTPLDKNGQTLITHMDYRSLHDTILKVDLLTDQGLTLLEKLSQKTGVDLNTIDLQDRATFALIQNADTAHIPELNGKFVRQMLLKTYPETFEELVKIISFCHGDNVWENNGEVLFEKGHSLSELPASREDIMLDLVRVGVDRTTAYKFSEVIRKGKLFGEDRNCSRRKNLRAAAKPLGKWYDDYCCRIRYMFSKASAVTYAMLAYQCAWFQVHYPEAYREVLPVYPNRFA